MVCFFNHTFNTFIILYQPKTSHLAFLRKINQSGKAKTELATEMSSNKADCITERQHEPT